MGDHVNMSLDQIAEERKVAAAGKTSNNVKRAERRMKAAPYTTTTSSSNHADATELRRRKVYVGNLDYAVAWQDLKDHMSQVGDVQHADVLMENRRSKGCGIVTYVREEDAARAIQVLNDSDLNGRQIFVREDREASKETTTVRRTQHADSNARVYVGNLSFRVAWQDLKDYMKQAGEISYADVLQDSNGRSRGCGLVEYARAEDAQTAIQTLNDTELLGRLIFVREDREPGRGSISSVVRRSSGGNGRGRNQRRSGSDSSNSIVRISNLPAETTWQDLKDLCKTVGFVERVEIAQHSDGSSKGYGTVRFRSKDDADAALNGLDRTDFGGREIEVIFENNE